MVANIDGKQCRLQVFVSSVILLSATILVSNNCGTVRTLFKFVAIQTMIVIV